MVDLREREDKVVKQLGQIAAGIRFEHPVHEKREEVNEGLSLIALVPQE